MRISDWSSDVCSSDLPLLAANQVTIDEGGTAVLSAAELAATDPDSDEGGLLFTVGGVTGGQFELVANPGIAITSFTQARSEAHTSELQSLMRISYAVFCLKKKLLPSSPCQQIHTYLLKQRTH